MARLPEVEDEYGAAPAGDPGSAPRLPLWARAASGALGLYLLGVIQMPVINLAIWGTWPPDLAHWLLGTGGLTGWFTLAPVSNDASFLQMLGVYFGIIVGAGILAASRRGRFAAGVILGLAALYQCVGTTVLACLLYHGE